MGVDPHVVVDLHGARAPNGVEIDALEVFLGHFRAALREFDRDRRGTLAKRGGRPDARDAASSAFRLVEFRTGSGIATLEPARPAGEAADDMPFEDLADDLSLTNLRALLEAVCVGERLAAPVVEALGSARRAVGDDGSFGIKVADGRQAPRVVFDLKRMDELQHPAEQGDEKTLVLTGRLHMIEADQPGRRVAIRAQGGVDWTCSYPDHLHQLVTGLVERLVRVAGTGRLVTAATGRLRIEHLDLVPEHAQDALFSSEPVSLGQLRAEQGIDRPQGLAALVDLTWENDEEGQRFLEATLGATRPR